jgi:hypothetical protein
MTRTILGNYVLRDEDIFTTVGSICILKDGTRVSTKNVLRVLADCKGCGTGITDSRELPFAKQTGMCFQCCTGNCLDFGNRGSCRTIHCNRVADAKRLMLRYCGERCDFWRIQPCLRNYNYVEFHWTWFPEDAFIRIGYDAFRLMHGLTKADAEEAVNAAIYKSLKGVIELTKPRYLKWLEEKKCPLMKQSPKSTLLFS